MYVLFRGSLWLRVTFVKFMLLCAGNSLCFISEFYSIVQIDQHLLIYSPVGGYLEYINYPLL